MNARTPAPIVNMINRSSVIVLIVSLFFSATSAPAASQSSSSAFRAPVQTAVNPASVLELGALQAQAKAYAEGDLTSDQLALEIFKDVKDLKTRAGIALGVIVESQIGDGQKIWIIKNLETSVNNEIDNRQSAQQGAHALRISLLTFAGAAAGVYAMSGLGDGGMFGWVSYVIVAPLAIGGGMLVGGAGGLLSTISFKKSLRKHQIEVAKEIQKSCEAILR